MGATSHYERTVIDASERCPATGRHYFANAIALYLVVLELYLVVLELYLVVLALYLVYLRCICMRTGASSHIRWRITVTTCAHAC